MLTEEETRFTFGGEKNVVVDVGAAPGGWTQYLAGFNQVNTWKLDRMFYQVIFWGMEPVPGRF